MIARSRRSRRCSRIAGSVGCPACRPWWSAVVVSTVAPSSNRLHLLRHEGRRAADRVHRRRRGERRARDRAGARGRRSRRADHPAERAVRGPLLLPHPARGRLRARAAGGGSSDAAPLPAARRRARRRDPGVVLRAGRPRALQLDRRVRRRRPQPRRLSQEPHPRWSGLSGEVLLQAGQHRVPRVRDAGSARSASRSAGTSGSPRPRAR